MSIEHLVSDKAALAAVIVLILAAANVWLWETSEFGRASRRQGPR
jgi:hypothetical protein